MQRPKLKILMCSEASFLSSGFGTYAREILSRLHATNKYDIAEFASYGIVNDPRDKEISWKYYANAVKDNDPRYQEYMSRPDNQFGRWRFEKVLLDFRPDIVCDIRDYWMSSYQALSPLRKYFHWILMPTVDSAPQQEEWIDTFLSADAVFTYSDWGAEVLKQQSSNNINYIDTVSPGVDLNTFKPLDQDAIKNQLGIPDKSIIIGSVMRNQKRKLIPELMISFRKVLDILEKDNNILGHNLYLYLHTSYPDMGWDIPELLKDNRIANKVLFTYSCRKCSHINCSVYAGPSRVCPKCLNKTMMMPSVTNGISNTDLAKVYNTFDMYVQYALCLGKDEPIKIKRDGVIQWLPISQTRIGDEAWTHKNRWKTISKVWQNLPKSHDKKVLKVSIRSDYETLLATENHEFLAYTQKELTIKHRSVKENIGYYLYNNKPLPEPGKYELKDLKAGDVLCYPIDDTVEDLDKIDISTEIDCSNYLVLDSFIETKSNYAYPRYIDIDNEFCKFVGLFAADGSWQVESSVNGIKITSHSIEKNNHNLAVLCFRELASYSNVKSKRLYKNRKGRDDALWSRLHAQLFSKWFSKHEDKKLPDWTMYLPLEKQKMVLQGLFMGDGHFIKDRNISVYCTVSSTLADQLKHILRRLRISFNARKVNKPGNRKPQYRFEVPGNIKNGEFLSNRIRNTRNTYYQNQHLIQIKNIVESDYNDDVWCVTVEDDHTMMTKIGATFQCEGFGMPQVEASACGIPIATINYSAMVDIIKKLNAISIEPKTLFKELETKAIRAYPDNDQLAKEIINFISQAESDIIKQKQRVRELAEKYYDWDIIAKKWEKYLDKLAETYRSNWDAPARYITEQMPNFEQMSDDKIFAALEEFCYKAFGDRNKLRSMQFLSSLQNADYGFVSSGANVQPYNYSHIIDNIKTEIGNINQSEHVRSNNIKFNDDFIQYAHIKSNT